MSLDVYLEDDEGKELHWGNITHNLNTMAQHAGLYEPLWRPETLTVGTPKGDDLIIPLSEGLKRLKSNPNHFKQFNAENGWGVYDNLVVFVERYLDKCREHPNAFVRISR